MQPMLLRRIWDKVPAGNRGRLCFIQIIGKVQSGAGFRKLPFYKNRKSPPYCKYQLENRKNLTIRKSASDGNKKFNAAQNTAIHTD